MCYNRNKYKIIYIVARLQEEIDMVMSVALAVHKDFNDVFQA